MYWINRVKYGITLPGHPLVLHIVNSLSDPMHPLPPWDGERLLHFLVLTFWPELQVLLQDPYSPHSPHCPSTNNQIKSNELFKDENILYNYLWEVLNDPKVLTRTLCEIRGTKKPSFIIICLTNIVACIATYMIRFRAITAFQAAV